MDDAPHSGGVREFLRKVAAELFCATKGGNSAGCIDSGEGA